MRSRIAPGLSIEIGLAEVDDVWDLSDGINASCERVAESLMRDRSAAELRQWERSLRPLTIDDLRRVQQRYPRMVLRNLQAPADRND